MSYYKVKYLSVKKNSAHITVADSSLHPLKYYRADQSERLRKLGEKEFLKEAIINFRNGNYHFTSRQGILGKIQDAMQILRNLELYHFLMDHDFSEFVYLFTKETEVSTNDWIKLKCDKNYVKQTLTEDAGRWKYIPEELQNNYEFALWYAENCASYVFFNYPRILQDEKSIWMKLLSTKGVLFRQITSTELKNDPDIVRTAFSAKTWPEHLPDLIGASLRRDTSFMVELIKLQPAIHYERLGEKYLQIPEIMDAVKKYNKWYKPKK